MGLWTLGGGGVQSSSTSSSDSTNGGNNKANGPNGSNSGNNRGGNGSKNPIAGMLQRELGISAQQGRKILDQRQKIQNVCSNLKEVSYFAYCILDFIVFATSLHTFPFCLLETVFEAISKAKSTVREKDPNVPQSDDEMSTSSHSKTSRKASHMD